MFISFTYVDAITGIPVTEEPALNGPAMPEGCVFGFALESLYPTERPKFYGTTARSTLVPGVTEISEAEYNAAIADEMAARGPPESITMRQAKLQLSRAGKLSAANTAIAAMTGQPGEEARIEWEYATTLRRDHPLVAGLGRTLGLDGATIDNLFRAASQIA